MSAPPVFTLVDLLPESNLTTKALHALDPLVPGRWTNLVGFENTIKAVSGETDGAIVRKIGERAVRLYNDRTQGYQRAVRLYHLADDPASESGAAARAYKVGGRYQLAPLLAGLRPKSENDRAIDFAVKLAAEQAAYGAIHGPTGGGLGGFAGALAKSRDEARVRVAALVCVDGLLALGSDFPRRVRSAVDAAGAHDLVRNATFARVAPQFPGEGPLGAPRFLQKCLGEAAPWLEDFTGAHALTVDKVAGKLSGLLGAAEYPPDEVAAALGATTNVFEHTGIQSVARGLIRRAVNEI